MPVGPLARIGKRNVELMYKWFPSLALFGGSAGTLFIYVSEWRAIAEYIPFYGGKFQEDQ